MFTGSLIASLLMGFLTQAPQPIFEVSAAGKAVELHDFPGGVFGQLDLARPAEVEVRAQFDIRWVDIRPKSAGIVPVIAGNHGSLRFQVKNPVPLTIEFNGDWKRVIHLFINPPEKNAPGPNAPNVRYFGPGVHEAGVIELKDGETMYLAEGAWVKGIVNSIGTKNVTIRGRGVLDASGFARRPASAGAPAEAAPQRQPARRNMIYFERTEGARVEGITLVNSPTWTFYVRNTLGTRVDGIHILNGRGACSTDGIDLVSSSDARVENVFIRTNDDNVVIKNTDDKPIHDVTVRKSVFWNEPCGNAIEIGFELRSSKIEKVRFEDIDIIRVERGSAISIHNGDSALVEDVVFDGIRVEDARHKLIDFAIVYGQYGPDRPESQEERSSRMDSGGAWDGILRCTPEQKAALAKNRGRIRNVRVRNLQVVDGALPFSVLSGWDPEHAVENVTIEGLTFGGKPIRSAAEGKFSVDNAPGLSFR
jgi:hypothetical protein